MQKLLTIDDLVSILRVDKGYIYRLSYKGCIPGKIVLGHRTIRFEPHAISEWLKQRTIAQQKGGSKYGLK